MPVESLLELCLNSQEVSVQYFSTLIKQNVTKSDKQFESESPLLDCSVHSSGIYEKS